MPSLVMSVWLEFWNFETQPSGHYPHLLTLLSELPYKNEGFERELSGHTSVGSCHQPVSPVLPAANTEATPQKTACLLPLRPPEHRGT